MSSNYQRMSELVSCGCSCITTLSTLKDLFTKFILLHNLIPKASAPLQWYRFKMSVNTVWQDRTRA